MSETIYQGYTWSRRLLVKNQIDGSAYDLTNVTIVFRMKRRSTDLVPAIELSIGDGLTLLPQAGDTVGMVDVALTREQTAALDADTYIAAAIATAERLDFVVIEPYRQLVRGMP